MHQHVLRQIPPSVILHVTAKNMSDHTVCDLTYSFKRNPTTILEEPSAVVSTISLQRRKGDKQAQHLFSCGRTQTNVPDRDKMALNRSTPLLTELTRKLQTTYSDTTIPSKKKRHCLGFCRNSCTGPSQIPMPGASVCRVCSRGAVAGRGCAGASA